METTPRSKQNSLTSFLFGALAAAAIVGVLGLGFMLGGRAGGTQPASAGVSANPAGAAPADNAGAPQGQPAQVLVAEGPQTGGEQQAGGPGEAPETGNDPAATPEAPAADPTPAPEPTPAPVDCPQCPKPASVDDVNINPALVVHDFYPPAFQSGHQAKCWVSIEVSVQVSEEATIWVEYTLLDATTSEEQYGTSADFTLSAVITTSGFVYPADIVVHAEDGSGNHSTFVPPVVPCY